MIELIRDNIECGVYPLGQRLPSERKLAAEFNVPQSQIRKALRTLVDEAYLECYRNNGYFIRKQHPKSNKLYRIAFCMESNLCESLKENFYTGLLFSYANAYNLNMIVYELPKEVEKQNKLFLELLESDIDGILCFPHAIETPFSALWEIKKRGLPLIFWDYSPFHGIFPSIGVDHFQSCFSAAQILAEYKHPVKYIGFEDKEQNVLKYNGFKAGCEAFGVSMDSPVLIPYSKLLSHEYLRKHLEEISERMLIFASTRLLTELVVGLMMDRGFMPGRDYQLLGTDMVKVMEGSVLQLDCMMRNREAIIKTLLSKMKNAVEKKQPVCCDYRIEMKYLTGKTLK